MKKTFLVFLAGGVGYCALETLWRGRTHPSMALCGGTAVALFRKMAPRAPDRLTLCLRGGALITGCELLCGLAFNRDRQVWDYSRLPGNFRGQICPLFSALWCLLCLPLSALCPVLERHLALLDKRQAGDYNKTIPNCAVQNGKGAVLREAGCKSPTAATTVMADAGANATG